MAYFQAVSPPDKCGVRHLTGAFAVNAALKTAYFLCEEFHHILDRLQAVDSAIDLLDKWIARIQA